MPAEAVHFVEDLPGLERVVEELAAKPEIGLDLEGDGLFRYRARLCVMQLSAPGGIWIVDTLSAWDAALLGPLLGPEGPTKVLHDAAYDARLLREYGVELGNVFDTAVAARFLGEPATGLSSLLASRCDVHLHKGMQKADWGRRPLRADAFSYLADDVRYLGALKASLDADVQSLGIGDAVETEVLHVLSRAQLEPRVTPAFLRVKGLRDMSAPQQGVVRALVALRDELASERDVPPFKVMGDGLIVELARVRPQTQGALQRVRGVRTPALGAHGKKLLDAVRRGEQEPPTAQELAGPIPPLPREQQVLIRSRERALSSWRKALARERGVDPQVVLPGHCLSELAARGADTPEELLRIAGIGEFRVRRDAQALLGALGEATSEGTPERAAEPGPDRDSDA